MNQGEGVLWRVSSSDGCCLKVSYETFLTASYADSAKFPIIIDAIQIKQRLSIPFCLI